MDPQMTGKASNYDKSMSDKKERCARGRCMKPPVPGPGIGVDGSLDRSNAGQDGYGKNFNVIGQPITGMWLPSEEDIPIDNNDRNYNVLGQKLRRMAQPPQAEPISHPGSGRYYHDRYNVLGQRLVEFEYLPCDQYEDKRLYNTIGQPIKPPPPKPLEPPRPVNPLCQSKGKTFVM